MKPRVHKRGVLPGTKKTIFSAVCVFGLLLNSAVGAQEPGEVPAEDADATNPAVAADSTEAAESDDAAPEDAASDDAASDDAASDDAAPETNDESEAGDAAEAEPVTDEASAPGSALPPEDEAIAPPTEGELESTDVEEQPDYFGGLEPSSPVYQLEEPSAPEKPRYTGPFRAGAVRFGLSVGGGGYGDQTYLILGFGLGYFLVNGLELHVDTDFWLIGEPFIATPSPGLRYVMWFVPKVHPYVGGFYRHYFSGGGYPDANSVGARAGAYLMTGRNSYFGLGAAYEHLLDNELFVDTDFIYPEVAFAFAF